MITAETKLVGLLGWPVKHSFSPLIHNAAFKAAALNWAYLAMPVKPEELQNAVKGLRALGFVGVNVTIPHKVAIMDCLDEVHEGAKLAGAVNTIVFRENGTYGYNTDTIGFIQALKSNHVNNIRGKQAVVLGAGGAARAIVAGLITEGIQIVYVAARKLEQATELTLALSNQADVRPCLLTELSHILPNTDILVQTTPVGMWPNVRAALPIEWSLLSSDTVICDIIYNPLMTAFLESALKHKYKVITGDRMLVEQGAEAFKLWTGINPDKNIMYDKLSDILMQNNTRKMFTEKEK